MNRDQIKSVQSIITNSLDESTQESLGGYKTDFSNDTEIKRSLLPIWSSSFFKHLRT